MPTKQRTQELLLSPGRFLVLGLDQAALSSLRQGCCPAGTVQNCPPLLGSRIGFGGIKCWQEGYLSVNEVETDKLYLAMTEKNLIFLNISVTLDKINVHVLPPFNDRL